MPPNAIFCCPAILVERIAAHQQQASPAAIFGLYRLADNALSCQHSNLLNAPATRGLAMRAVQHSVGGGHVQRGLL